MYRTWAIVALVFFSGAFSVPLLDSLPVAGGLTKDLPVGRGKGNGIGNSKGKGIGKGLLGGDSGAVADSGKGSGSAENDGGLLGSDNGVVPDIGGAKNDESDGGLLGDSTGAVSDLPVVPSIPLPSGATGGKTGNILSILQILPLKEGLNGLVGDLINFLRLLLSQVRLILNGILPSLSTVQVSELEKLLSNPEMTNSELLQKLDDFIYDQDDIDLIETYNATKTDVQDKVEAVLQTLQNIVGTLFPDLAPLIAQLRDVVNNDLLTLLDQDKAIGQLLVAILKPVQDLLDPFLNSLNLLNIQNLINLNSGLLGALGRLLREVLIFLDTVLNSVLGSAGLLSGLLGPSGLIGGLLGGNGLLGNLL